MKKIKIFFTVILFFALIVFGCNAMASTSINYNYSSDVSTGTIRYISQNVNSGYFKDAYWGSWKSQASIECGTSCISMALSYVGINKTPETILTTNNGITYFTGWGATYLTPSFSSAMSNYLSSNGKYSPPIIHLSNYSSAGHFVLVVGQISSNVYEVLDPYNDSIWNITINGTTATYTKGGVTKTDSIASSTDVRQYYNENAIIDTEEPEIKDVYVYDVSPTGFTVHCIVTDNIGLGYVQFPTWTNYEQDDIIWGDPGAIAGTAWELNYRVNICDHNNETDCYYNVDIYCYDTAGNVKVYSTGYYMDSIAPVISNVQVEADADGYTVTCDVSDNVGIDYVLFPSWTTYNGQDDLEGADGSWPYLDIWEGTIEDGKVTFRVNRSDHNNEMGEYNTHIYAYDLNGNTTKYTLTYVFEEESEDYISGDLNEDFRVSIDDIILARKYLAGNATINELALDVNADGVCDEKDLILLRQYVVGGYDVELQNVKNNWSEWSEWSTTPVTSSVYTEVETKTQYQYSDKQTTTSTSASLPGWTQTGSSTSYGDYGAWSAWQRETVAGSDTRAVETATVYGYYYFLCPNCGAHMHGYPTCYTWAGGCGGGSVSNGTVVFLTTPHSSAGLYDFHETGKYATDNFPQYGRLFKWVDNGVSAWTGYRYRDRSKTTTYSYYKWSDWSSWSDTAYTSSDTRQIQTRTLYRYRTRQ